MLPSDPTAEARVLGCCLLPDTNSNTLKRLRVAGVCDDWFFNEHHKFIWGAICTLQARQAAEISEVTVHQELNGTAEMIGGLKTLYALTDPVLNHLSSHEAVWFDSLKSHYQRRKLIIEADRVRNFAFSPEPFDAAKASERLATTLSEFTSTPREAVPVLTIPKLMLHVHDPEEYRFAGGWLGKEQDNSLLGAPGVGKTRLANALICHHCAGRHKFLGLDLRGGPLNYLVIGSENTRSRLKSDLTAIAKTFTEKECALIAQHATFYLAHEDPDSKGGRLNDPDSFKRLLQLVKQVKPDVIVLDTLASLTSGLNLNDDTDMMFAVFQAQLLRRAAAPGCSNLILHHAKPGSEAIKQALDPFEGGSFGRNSRALFGQVRGQWNLVQGDREDRNRLVLASGKMSDALPFDPVGLKWVDGEAYVDDPDFDLSALLENLDGVGSTSDGLTVRNLLLAVKQGHHKSSDLVTVLTDAYGIGRATVYRRIKSAVKSKLLEPTPPLGSYTLTDKGLAAAK